MLQSLITRALDDDEFVVLASIDLSAAFNIVDVDLLIKRLVILGLPNDGVKLIEIWLRERYFYINGNVPLEWLILSIETFKVKCKKLYH